MLGSPGIGKSTVCLRALHDPRIAERFRTRRHFVRLDGAYTAQDMLVEVGRVLGIPAEEAKIRNLMHHLQKQPAALALDNVETPWTREELPTEEVLAQLATIPRVTLVVTLRGQSRPAGVQWREALNIVRLRDEDAKRVFLAIAGDKHQTDAHLDSLLVALDGVPLAIELMAHAAEAEPDLDGVWQRWQTTERTAMLKRGKADHRLLSLAVSLELSIKGPRMTEPARRLLSLLAVLPDGVARIDIETLLPGCGNAAAATLRQTGLAFDEAGRLRMLAPIRSHVADHCQPGRMDLARAIDHYTQLASDLGPKCGKESGAEAIARLAAETANIENALRLGLGRSDPRSVVEAVIAFAKFQRFSGLGTVEPLDQAVLTSKTIDDALSASANFHRGLLAIKHSDYGGARQRYLKAQRVYRRIGDVVGEANCIFRLGETALRRSRHDSARQHFERAQRLYRQVGDVLGEAHCILSLGDIALGRSDHEGARQRYETAQRFYRQLSNVLGEANCILRLGNIALTRSDHDVARQRYKEALPLYRRIGDVLGEANCIKRVGDVALGRSDHDVARERYEEALPLYRRVGDVLGEAGCIYSLGDIALARSDHDLARERYEEALPLFCRVGSVRDKASCIKRLGDVALARSNHNVARERYEAALPLYRRVGDVRGEANCIESLGDIALRRSDYDGARERYEAAPTGESAE